MNDPKKPATGRNGAESPPAGCITLTNETIQDGTSFLLLENGDKVALE